MACPMCMPDGDGNGCSWEEKCLKYEIPQNCSYYQWSDGCTASVHNGEEVMPSDKHCMLCTAGLPGHETSCYFEDKCLEYNIPERCVLWFDGCMNVPVLNGYPIYHYEDDNLGGDMS